MTFVRASAFLAGTLLLTAAPVAAQDICMGFGPQTPRDISLTGGSNPRAFNLAPAASTMNLCDIHAHVNAEHKGPGFSVPGGEGDHGGWKCNETDSLTATELEDPSVGEGAFHGAKPGDTLEVHWVYTTCDAVPANGLGSCFTDACTNPQLRVESQVFLLVNNAGAQDFRDYAHGGHKAGGLYQPKALPEGTGTPVTFAGSTTGPKFTQAQCSPFQVTWSVRPTCAKLDIASLHAWAEAGNPFEENHAHGVRQLVTAPELLAPIE